MLKNESFLASDLDEYLSSDSKFFKMFRQRMHPIVDYDALIFNKVFIAQDSFVYRVSYPQAYEDYLEEMRKLGFRRLPDIEKVLKHPLSFEEFERELKKRKQEEHVED